MPTEEVFMSQQVVNSKVGSNIGSLSSIINPGGFEYINGVRKVVQVPVQDSRTKALIYKLTT